MSTVECIPENLFQRLVSFRRDLHQHPELSWKEERTAERIEAEARTLGLSPRRVAGTGVVAELPGQSEGPFIALRGDIDALPIQEETGLEFASDNPGVMHACGHDGHTTILLGAAEMLLSDPPPLPIRLIWQPAEETGGGARTMVEHGVLEQVAMIFGGHLDRHYEPGILVVTEGIVNASADSFWIDIHGQEGHGARPHEALDAVVVGSLLVTALQTIVSREINPADPSVLSVGMFEAGTAPNVIAGSARLGGTIRAQSRETRARLHKALQRIAVAVGQLHGADIQVRFEDGTPPLINDARTTALARAAALKVVDEEHVVPLITANMGGEDFASYLDHVPGCYIRYGAQVPGRESYPAHSSRFDFDESALAVGAAWMNQVARVAGEEVLANGC